MTFTERLYEESYPPWVQWNVPSTATLTSITPSTAGAGATPIQLDCTGTGFTAGARIFRDATPLATTVVTAGTVLRTTVFIPDPPGVMNIRVQNDGQLPTNARVFTATGPGVELAAGDEEAPVPAGAAEDQPPPAPTGRRRQNGGRRT